MAIPPSLTRISRLYFRPKTTVASSPVPFAASSHVTFLSPSKSSFSLPPSSSPPTLNFCAAYAPRAQLFASRRAEASLPSHRCRRPTRVFGPLPGNLPGSEPTELPSAPISSEPGFEDFVKRKLPMDEPKTKEMHAFDSDNYIQPDESNPPPNAKAGAEIGECKRRVASDGVFDGRNVFVKMDIPAKKVKVSKCLKKAPNGEPCILTRGGVLPPKWDGSSGTVVLVNKPKGWTSFTVCDKLRGLVKVKKVGHAGTLDPMATGLLIVCVGKATKSVERFQSMIKGYSGIFRLGETTSTLDADSPVIQRESWEHIKDDDIKKAAATFCGEIWQVPPMFSAVKVRGQRMYEKARRGEIMELSPRRITVSEFVIQRSLEDRQNLVFRARCSKGTYIRSLCADFGMALGSCAHLTALKRDSIGQYSAEDAWEFEELSETILGGRL